MRIELYFHWNGQAVTLLFYMKVVRCRKFLLEHSCLTALRKNGLGPGQDLPPTVSPFRLWPCRVVWVADYKETISSFRLVVQDPPAWCQWMVYVPYLYPTAFILFVHMGEVVVCATRCYVCGDGRWYYLRGSIPR